ncbi:MAG: sensor histidine kinase [Anaerolineae bacterium]|nr:sensor histidine kinase [Anaerolineae bacterium]
MLREKHKITHLLGELISYALAQEPQRVTITIEDLADRIQVTVEDTGAQRDERECQQVERFLNAAVRNELKDYYSGLAGEGSLEPCNLRVVGMVVDGGRVERREAGTRLTVWWARE